MFRGSKSFYSPFVFFVYFVVPLLVYIQKRRRSDPFASSLIPDPQSYSLSSRSISSFMSPASS